MPRFKPTLLANHWAKVLHVIYGPGYAAAARALGVDRSSLWRWTHGKQPLPRAVAQRMHDASRARMEAAGQAFEDLRTYLARPEYDRKPRGFQKGNMVWRRRHYGERGPG